MTGFHAFPHVPLRPTAESHTKVKYVAAKGERMSNYGEKKVSFRTGSDTGLQSINFQVTDVTKPLAAVSCIVEKGNIVQFGPRDDDNHVHNPRTETNIMKRGGRRFVMEGDFVQGLGPFAGQA